MSTPGITSLAHLLRSMSPTLDDSKTYLFATISSDPFTSLSNTQLSQVEMLLRESEGWTMIIPQEAVQHLHLDLKTAFPSKKITLNVHSSLDAVGFLAAVTTRLANDVGVGVNPVSGFYHDHLFVPGGREEVVMSVLRRMAEEAREERSS